METGLFFNHSSPGKCPLEPHSNPAVCNLAFRKWRHTWWRRTAQHHHVCDVIYPSRGSPWSWFPSSCYGPIYKSHGRFHSFLVGKLIWLSWCHNQRIITTRFIFELLEGFSITMATLLGFFSNFWLATMLSDPSWVYMSNFVKICWETTEELAPQSHPNAVLWYDYKLTMVTVARVTFIVPPSALCVHKYKFVPLRTETIKKKLHVFWKIWIWDKLTRE